MARGPVSVVRERCVYVRGSEFGVGRDECPPVVPVTGLSPRVKRGGCDHLARGQGSLQFAGAQRLRYTRNPVDGAIYGAGRTYLG